MKRTILLSLAALLLLGGCAAQSGPSWQRSAGDPFSDQQLAADQGDCRRQAQETLSARYGGAKVGQEYWQAKRELITGCMEGRGWIWQEGGRSVPRRGSY